MGFAVLKTVAGCVLNVGKNVINIMQTSRGHPHRHTFISHLNHPICNVSLLLRQRSSCQPNLVHWLRANQCKYTKADQRISRVWGESYRTQTPVVESLLLPLASLNCLPPVKIPKYCKRYRSWPALYDTVCSAQKCY